jgi:hypothetical protein
MRAHWEHAEAEAAAADAAERERLRRLAEEVEEFNTLRLREMSEAERRERCVRLTSAVTHCSSLLEPLGGRRGPQRGCAARRGVCSLLLLPLD